jgi:hypothetical protein
MLPLCCRRAITTQVEVREHESGSHSELLVTTLDRQGLLTGAMCFLAELEQPPFASFLLAFWEP